MKSMLSSLPGENTATKRKLVGLNLEETSPEQGFACAGKPCGHNFGYEPPHEMERKGNDFF
jgi:hypothetical protein